MGLHRSYEPRSIVDFHTDCSVMNCMGAIRVLWSPSYFVRGEFCGRCPPYWTSLLFLESRLRDGRRALPPHLNDLSNISHCRLCISLNKSRINCQLTGLTLRLRSVPPKLDIMLPPNDRLHRKRKVVVMTTVAWQQLIIGGSCRLCLPSIVTVAMETRVAVNSWNCVADVIRVEPKVIRESVTYDPLKSEKTENNIVCVEI